MAAIVDIMLNVFLVLMLLSLFNLVRYMLKIRKVMKMNKDNPNVKGITIVNGEVKVIEKEGPSPVATSVTSEPVIIEKVKDLICGMELEKKDAYRIVKDGVEHFFCSWECRERFLQSNE